MKELKTISDEELLRQIKSGNDDAMECLLERYRDMVRKEARRFFLSPAIHSVPVLWNN